MQKKCRIALGTMCLVTSLTLGGCASIVDGRSQEISVNTNPAEASCSFFRQSQVIATLPVTPSAVLIDKTKDDLLIKCNKQGYQEATYMNHSGFDIWSIFGGIIGIGIDAASGAINKYDSPINITLVPVQAAYGPRVKLSPTS